MPDAARLVCLGVSYQTAPLEARERLAYSPRELSAGLERFAQGRQAESAVSELVILSTCNRTEFYLAVSPLPSERDPAPADPFEWLKQFLAETREPMPSEVVQHFYHLAGPEVALHLGRVAAGLDSQILGEPQILGQVSAALEAGLHSEHHTAGPVLSALFRAALQAGKRARTETLIGRNPASVPSVAVKRIETILGDVRQLKVLVVGAGDMAVLTLKALQHRGVQHVTVTSRTPARAHEAARQWNATALPFEQLADGLAAADVVISSTGASNHVIPFDMVQQAIQRRGQRPLVLIDIAVPRDIDPTVSALPGIHYCDIDQLQAELDGSLAEREREVAPVERIVAEEAERYAAWLAGLDVAPVIAGLRAKADAIGRAEIERLLRRRPEASTAERDQIELLVHALINKLLHEPTVRLKAEAGKGQSAEYAAALRHLFALEEA